MKILYFLLSILSMFVKSVVISVGWGWFITPVFGVAVPPITAIWGIVYLLTLLVPGVFSEGKTIFEYAEEYNVDFVLYSSLVSIIYSLAVLLVMFILHLF